MACYGLGQGIQKIQINMHGRDKGSRLNLNSIAKRLKLHNTGLTTLALSSLHKYILSEIMHRNQKLCHFFDGESGNCGSQSICNIQTISAVL